MFRQFIGCELPRLLGVGPCTTLAKAATVGPVELELGPALVGLGHVADILSVAFAAADEPLQ